MMLNILNNEDISILDRQVEQLMEFKPIPEHEVKVLCEKVSFWLFLSESSVRCSLSVSDQDR